MNTFHQLHQFKLCWISAALLASCESERGDVRHESDPTAPVEVSTEPPASKLHSVEFQKIFLSAEGRGRSREESKVLGEQIRKQLQAGSDFGALASRYSEDSFATDGGRAIMLFDDLGEGQFRTFVTSSPEGEISELFEHPEGFTIAVVRQRRYELPSLSSIMNKIKQNKAEEATPRKPSD